MFVFFFNDTATTEIYTLSLHDALPIYLQRIHLRRGESLADRDDASVAHRRDTAAARADPEGAVRRLRHRQDRRRTQPVLDRKSTRLNSSHSQISYAVFCLKKKKKNKQE